MLKFRMKILDDNNSYRYKSSLVPQKSCWIDSNVFKNLKKYNFNKH